MRPAMPRRPSAAATSQSAEPPLALDQTARAAHAPDLRSAQARARSGPSRAPPGAGPPGRENPGAAPASSAVRGPVPLSRPELGPAAGLRLMIQHPLQDLLGRTSRSHSRNRRCNARGTASTTAALPECREAARARARQRAENSVLDRARTGGRPAPGELDGGVPAGAPDLPDASRRRRNRRASSRPSTREPPGSGAALAGTPVPGEAGSRPAVLTAPVSRCSRTGSPPRRP